MAIGVQGSWVVREQHEVLSHTSIGLVLRCGLIVTIFINLSSYLFDYKWNTHYHEVLEMDLADDLEHGPRHRSARWPQWLAVCQLLDKYGWNVKRSEYYKQYQQTWWKNFIIHEFWLTITTSTWMLWYSPNKYSP